MKKLILNIFLFASVCVISWLCWSAYSIASFKNFENPPQSDCAIILGAAVYGSKPSPVFEERIRHAIEIYKNGRVKKLIFTGGIGEDKKYAESMVAAQYAVQEGVSPFDIYTEAASRTTYQNLVEAKRLMQRHELHSAVIVSDPFHLRRAQAMADDLGMQALTSATPTSRYQSFSTRAPFLLRELYFYQLYLLTRHADGKHRQVLD